MELEGPEFRTKTSGIRQIGNESKAIEDILFSEAG